MKLEYCNEHSNCTIVDGEHTSRRPVVLPDDIVRTEQLDTFKKATEAKLRDLAAQVQDRFRDSSQKVEDASAQLSAAIKDLKQAADALQAEFYKSREDADRKIAAITDAKRGVPNVIKTVERKVEKVVKEFGAISDKLIKLDEAITQERTAREAEIRALVEL